MKRLKKVLRDTSDSVKVAIINGIFAIIIALLR